MGTILFIISVVLSLVLYPLGFIYSVIRLTTSIRFKTALKRLDQVLKSTAIAVDQTGNAFMQEVFNDLLISKSGHKFGNPDETISSVLGRNKQGGTLNLLGKAIAWCLNKIDPNHVEMAVEKEVLYTANKIMSHELGKEKVKEIVENYKATNQDNSFLANQTNPIQ